RRDGLRHLEERAEEPLGLPEAPARGDEAGEVEARREALHELGLARLLTAPERAPFPLQGEAFGELEVPLRARGVDEERQRRGGERGGREVAELAREHDRGGVVPLGLGQDVAALSRGLAGGALALEGLGAEREEAAPLARRHGRARRDQLLQRGRVELRLE